LGKGPFGRVAIGLARFGGDGFCPFSVFLASSRTSLGLFSIASEVFRAKKRVGVRCNNGFRDSVIGLQFQPSLSLTLGD